MLKNANFPHFNIHKKFLIIVWISSEIDDIFIFTVKCIAVLRNETG